MKYKFSLDTVKVRFLNLCEKENRAFLKLKAVMLENCSKSVPPQRQMTEQIDN